MTLKQNLFQCKKERQLYATIQISVQTKGNIQTNLLFAGFVLIFKCNKIVKVKETKKKKKQQG